ncbi:hypothetical protein H0E87_026872 [Populus deltoides]|uniref:Uncharacterized protein n=1 Tax=Populus deltoides TaxID=3696 RepID=A0A8T2WWL5_POPDE|nr:hypothetical protein H0E87_026872 [Populus deltoides]
MTANLTIAWNCICANFVVSHYGNSPLLGWGLGVGIMYMMSTGKAEISKLSTSMEVMCGLPIADDVEYPSSVLTEEPEPEPEPAVLEMDQLEAGLESELCKNIPGPALKLLDMK